MSREFSILVMVFWLAAMGLAMAQEGPKVGGYEQYPPGPLSEAQIGAGWGHRSMTYGVMNMMSGMATQVATILRSGKADAEMQKRLAAIIDHIADMLNEAPAYMMGTKKIDSKMMKEMHDMLRELESMRGAAGLR
ncbi:MAG: hypothetical protein WHX93_08695 [bacterium]